MAMDRLNNHATVAPTARATNAITHLSELNGLVKVQKPGPRQELVNYWARLCGLPPP